MFKQVPNPLQSSASTQDTVVLKSIWKKRDLQTQHSESVAQENRLLATFFKSAPPPPNAKKSAARSGHRTPHFTQSSGGSQTTYKGWPVSPTPWSGDLTWPEGLTVEE